MAEFKLTKIERDQDNALEIFIHRLVGAGVCSYSEAIACLGSRQCLEMRQSKLKFDENVSKPK